LWKVNVVTLSEFSLTGKIALVIGAGGGIGLEIAKSLAKAGARVIDQSELAVQDPH
jgi:NAD(P)-dependent dehydrogenase (short-subunit alcohol dehydrogenase family)